MEIFFSKLILEIRQFQRVNNIKKKCVSNTQYLHTTMKKIGVANSFKAEAVITIGNQSNGVTNIVAGHVVITVDNTEIVDPSYEVFSLSKKQYFFTVKEFMDFVNLHEEEDRSQFNIKKIIKYYMKFRIYADAINSGEFVSEKEYYEELEKYIGL